MDHPLFVIPSSRHPVIPSSRHLSAGGGPPSPLRRAWRSRHSDTLSWRTAPLASNSITVAASAQRHNRSERAVRGVGSDQREAVPSKQPVSRVRLSGLKVAPSRESVWPRGGPTNLPAGTHTSRAV